MCHLLRWVLYISRVCSAPWGCSARSTAPAGRLDRTICGHWPRVVQAGFGRRDVLHGATEAKVKVEFALLGKTRPYKFYTRPATIFQHKWQILVTYFGTDHGIRTPASFSMLVATWLSTWVFIESKPWSPKKTLSPVSPAMDVYSQNCLVWIRSYFPPNCALNIAVGWLSPSMRRSAQLTVFARPPSPVCNCFLIYMLCQPWDHPRTCVMLVALNSFNRPVSSFIWITKWRNGINASIFSVSLWRSYPSPAHPLLASHFILPCSISFLTQKCQPYVPTICEWWNYHHDITSTSHSEGIILKEISLNELPHSLKTARVRHKKRYADLFKSCCWVHSYIFGRNITV